MRETDFDFADVWKEPEEQRADNARSVGGGQFARRGNGNQNHPCDERRVTPEAAGPLLRHLWTLEASRAGDDFDDFVCDGSLSYAIHVERQSAYQFRRIL